MSTKAGEVQRLGTEISSADIPAEMIEAKRAIVLIRRKCREFSK